MPKIVIPFVIFYLVFSVYIVSHNVTISDSLWSLHSSWSMIKEKNLNLDEYKQILQPNDYKIERVNGHYYSVYPPGTYLLTAPFVYFFSKADSDFEKSLYTFENIGIYQMLIASIITAVSAVMIFRLSDIFLKNKALSILVSLVFAFGTSAWSTASRSLWQHGPVMLMLIFGIYILARARERPALSAYAALPLSFAFIIRPISAVPLLLLSIYVFVAHRAYFSRYLLGVTAVLTPFLILNLLNYGALLPPYYTCSNCNVIVGGQTLSNLYQILDGLLGTLLSPSRGLFVFSPILLFSIYGIYTKWKEKNLTSLDCYFIAIILIHWLSTSLFIFWWGGHTFGPRYFTDVLPLFVYFLIPALQYIGKKSIKFRITFAYLFTVTAIFSFFIHYRGSFYPETWRWNSYPIDVDQKPSRVWDWKDPQFLR